MSLKRRIENLVNLGDYIRSNNQDFVAAKNKAAAFNPWFTGENIDKAVNAISEQMLKSDVIENWVCNYSINENSNHEVGLILAGNIPLVGFHDIMCAYLAGHLVRIKASGKDTVLTEYLINYLINLDKNDPRLQIDDNLKGISAIIATGSNHSAKQFERYFSHVPHIIRRNRNAVGVITQNDSQDDIEILGEDIFSFFGLGCRNVSKVFFPKNYNLPFFLETLHDKYKEIILHQKYKNNYDYNYALYLLNKENFLANGAVILRNHPDIVSRIACLHYEEYEHLNALSQELKMKEDQIQCIVSNVKLEGLNTIPFGKAQYPKINDYADGVDTMEFLTNLK